MIKRDLEDEIEESHEEAQKTYLHCLSVLTVGEDDEYSFSDENITAEQVKPKVTRLSTETFLSDTSKIVRALDKSGTSVDETIKSSKKETRNEYGLITALIIGISACVTFFVVGTLSFGDELHTKKIISLIRTSFYAQSNGNTKVNPGKIILGSQPPLLVSDSGETNSLTRDFLEKPKIVDLHGTGSFFLRRIFSECLDESGMNEMHNLEFLSGTSFCMEHLNFNQNPQAKIIMVVRNPLTRTAQSFLEKKDPKSPQYDEKVADMHISDFLQSSFHYHNFLTRVMTSKFEGKLDRIDLEHAKAVFDRKNIAVTVFPDHINLMSYVQTNFGLNMSHQMLKCIDSQLQKEWKFNADKSIHLFVSDNSKILREANEYDMQLFMHVLKMSTEDA